MISVTWVAEDIYARMHSEADAGKFQWAFEALLLMRNYRHQSASDREHQQWSQETMKLQKQDQEKQAIKQQQAALKRLAPVLLS